MKIQFLTIKQIHLIFVFLLGILLLVISPQKQLWALNYSEGENIFIQHCSGCHIKGGNIIRRSKTLKLSALKRNGIDDPRKIAEIAKKGIGSMDGYEKVLAEGEGEIVAIWIWDQAQKAWVQG